MIASVGFYRDSNNYLFLFNLTAHTTTFSKRFENVRLVSCLFPLPRQVGGNYFLRPRRFEGETSGRIWNDWTSCPTQLHWANSLRHLAASVSPRIEAILLSEAHHAQQL